jgi:hypothetical protein
VYPLSTPLLSLTLPSGRRGTPRVWSDRFLDGLLPEGPSRLAVAEDFDRLASYRERSIRRQEDAQAIQSDGTVKRARNTRWACRARASRRRPVETVGTEVEPVNATLRPAAGIVRLR